MEVIQKKSSVEIWSDDTNVVTVPFFKNEDKEHNRLNREKATEMAICRFNFLKDSTEIEKCKNCESKMIRGIGNLGKVFTVFVCPKCLDIWQYDPVSKDKLKINA